MDIRTPQRRDTNDPNDLEYALASLGRTTITNERLRAENASLRAQLCARLPAHLNHTNGDILFPPTPSSPSIAANGMVPAAQHEALARRYAELEASHATLKAKNELMRKTLKDSKALIKQWQAYLRQKKEKHGESRSVESVSTASTASTTVDPSAETARDDVDITPRASSVVHEPTKLITVGNQGGSPEMTSSPPRLTAPQVNVQMQPQTIGGTTSSQATVDDLDPKDDTPVQASSSDFEPIVVSTRCLKRKYGPDRGIGSPARRIKQEPKSPSLPIAVQSINSERTMQFAIDTISSDDCLDNFGPAMLTPRRPKRVSDLRLRATTEELSGPAPQLRRSASSLSDGDASHSDDQPTPFLPGIDYGTRDKEARFGMGIERTSRNHHANILKPISANIPRQQRAPEGQNKPTAKFRRTGAREKILLVSEDGDDGFSQKRTHLRNPPQDEISPGVAVEDRLDDLLNGPSPERNSVLSNLFAPTTASTRNLDRPASAQLRTPVSVAKRVSPVKPTTSLRHTPAPAKSPPSGKSTIATSRVTVSAAAQDKSPLPVRPEEEPLRIRPASSLRLDDFKINPTYMGTDFAFADTIRGRDARQNLHACTRADCCGGALEKVIKMGGTAMSGRTDADALKAFIGPAWQALMGAKKPTEAKQLVQQAHAFCFANEHGKHRQAFERRSTPPGYWRADFPTTQEQAVDRETADEMQRKEVESRHREAMREGGRWIFRDE